MLNVKIGDRVRAIKAGEFSWGLTVEPGQTFFIVNAKDVHKLSGWSSEEYFEVVE